MTLGKKFNNTLCADPPPKEPYATIFVFHIEAAGALGRWRGVGDGIALTVWRGTSKTNHINLLRDIPHVSWPGSRDPAFGELRSSRVPARR